MNLRNKLVLMPVNPNSSFLYWEITDKTVEEFGADPKNIELLFKLFDEKHNEILEFDSNFALSDYYINHENNHKAIYAKLFLKVGSRLEYILSSNIIKMFDRSIKSSKNSSLIDDDIRDNLIYTSTLLGGR
jgi:hypothetical protein